MWDATRVNAVAVSALAAVAAAQAGGGGGCQSRSDDCLPKIGQIIKKLVTLTTAVAAAW